MSTFTPPKQIACTYCGHISDYDSAHCAGCSAPLDVAREEMQRLHAERVRRETQVIEEPPKVEGVRSANDQDLRDLAEQAKDAFPQVQHVETAVSEAKTMLPRILGIFGISLVLGLIAGALLGRWGIFVILIGAILGAALLQMKSMRLFGRVVALAPRLLGALMGAATSGVAWFIAALIARLWRVL